jgi:divalent metal cation (Fe/Co/Zn/Cd) transporter
LVFSAVVLIIAGIMRIFDAIWAFRYSGTPVDDLHNALFGHSLTAYGWLWLIVGIILIVSGFLLLSPTATISAEVARWIGIFAAAIGAITAIAWVPYYPVWSLIYIGIAILVIYGLSNEVGAEAKR